MEQAPLLAHKAYTGLLRNFNKLIEKNIKILFFTSTKFSNILPKTSLTLCKMKLCSLKLLCELSTYLAVQKPFKVNSPPYSQWLTSACGVCLFDNNYRSWCLCNQKPFTNRSKIIM
jgi:hypothetical protein